MFPPYKGIVPICLSWIFAPILSATAAATIFGTVRWAVLRSPEAESRSYLVLPPLVLITRSVSQSASQDRPHEPAVA